MTFTKRHRYEFYLPQLGKTEIIRARDEATAVWKLLQLYKFRESEIMDYKMTINDGQGFGR